MARKIAAGDDAGASHAQNRAFELTLLLSIPCVVAFLIVPDLIMRALFQRGAFTAANAQAAGATLSAYAIGLIPFVLIRSATATFFARGDTATPVKASLIAVAANIAFKIALMGPLAQVGLALATSIGAWINLALVLWFASRADLLRIDARLKRSLLIMAACGAVLATFLWYSSAPVMRWLSSKAVMHDEIALLVLAAASAVIYGGLVIGILGKGWFGGFRGAAKV
jgi:putative peptidoglycan lipid II flippase